MNVVQGNLNRAQRMYFFRREAQNMKTELIIIWETGEKEVHAYETEEEARSAGEGYKMAFGNQISWTGTRKITSWSIAK